jgi:hypothetical protein
MSGADIDKGTRWADVLSGSLEASSCAIVCLTPESLQSIWVAFEAGAISKATGGPQAAKSRIWTYMVGLERSEIALTPFAEYQATTSTAKDTFRLVESINGLSPDPASAETLKRRFDQVFWPHFSARLEHARTLKSIDPPRRTGPEPNALLTEILNSVRAIQEELRRAPKNELDRSIMLSSNPLAKLIADELGRRGHFYDNLRISKNQAGNYEVTLGRMQATVASSIADMVLAGQLPASAIVDKMVTVSIEPVRDGRRRG